MKKESKQKTEKFNKMRHRKFFLALLLLIIGGAKVWGQAPTNYPYVFTYTATSGGTTTTYYLGYSDAATLSREDSFNPKCIWYANNTLNDNNRTISNGSSYLSVSNASGSGNLSLGTTGNNFRQNNSNLCYYYTKFTRPYYHYCPVYYDNGTWKYAESNTGNTRVTPYLVTVNEHPGIQAGPTVTPPEGGNEFHALGSKTYTHSNASEVKGYTHYAFNNTNHYWYDGEDHNTPPSAGSGSYTYRWVLSVNMNGYASVDQNGVVTYSTAVPEYSRVGSLSCEATNTETGVTLPVKYYSITFYNPNYLLDPVINSEANNSGTLDVWFTYPETAPSDLKFYYTTDGTQPTMGDNEITAGVHFTVTDGTTLNVMAAATGYHTSEVVSEMVHLNTGILGNTVILHDHEDHRWTYYSGVDASVDGGNYNSTYAGKIYSPNPRNVTITYNANGGQVSISETQNKFVYCKTLEESATAGEYKYQVISNPFSKRPTGKGFGGWKIISGGQYVKGHADNDILSLDEEITFENLPYTSVNCTSANLVLEATWVNANVTYITTNPGSGTQNYSFTGGTYETNFIVLKNVNYSRTMSINSPCTIMMVEPDGSADYRESHTFSGNITPNNNSVTKIENAKWNPSGVVDTKGKSLWIGRGVTCSGTQRAIQCVTSDVTVNQTVKIESGSFASFAHFYHTDLTAGNLQKQWVVFGCDYDRATNDNSKLTIPGSFIVEDMYWVSWTTVYYSLNLTDDQEVCRVWSKSGTFMGNVGISDAAKDNSYYLSVYGTTRPRGKRYFEIEGGEWCANIAGGQDVESGIDGNVTFSFRMRGGKVRGSIYGAAEQNTVSGSRVLVFTGGQIGGWIAGGANGIDEGSGTMSGSSYVYFGGNAETATRYQERTDHATTAIRNSIGGYVFGSGCGAGADSQAGEVTVSTNVVLADNASVEYGVYGGGAYGYSSGTANVYVTGGQVASTYDSQYSVFGGVYGGARQNDGGSANIYMTGGLISGSTHNNQQGGGLYGGSNSSGILSGNVNIKALGGTVGSGAMVSSICGGGYGASTRVDGNVDITLGSATNAPLLFASVYGGSAKGIVNTNTSNHTHITVNNATMAGYVYGGGMGDSDNAADVNGNVTIDFKGGLTRYVFGGNYINGAPKGTITINMTGGTVYEMFGGGDQADYVAPSDGYPQINISGGRIQRYNYGGEDAGGNVFGGGNLANVTGSPVVNITGANTQIEHSVYGGGNNGNVTGNATVHITDAKVGTSTIQPEEKGSVYGAGFGAATVVGGNTSVTIDGKAIVAGNVYGGGEAGDVAGTTTVVIGDTGNSSTSVNDVFGAGKGADSDVAGEGGTHVTIRKSASVKGSVYGGAEEGSVRGEVTESSTNYGHNVTNVTIENGLVAGNVYGGGKMGIVNGRTIVNMLAGTIEGNLFGGALGTQGSVFVRGLKTINMKGGLVVGDIYGGSQNADDANEYYKEELGENETQPADNRNSIFVNISGGQVGENVYGGGFYGEISGSVTVNVGVDAINNGPDHVKNINKLSLANTDKVMTKLEGSIYAGSDWGTITEGGQFGPNNITGYSNIYIDGGGYDMNATLQGNYMNISGSIYGSGTSSDAGSQGRRIFIRNYGLDHAVDDAVTNELTYSTCSRKLYTIQRADSVFLENSHITFRGQGDMASPSTTQHYSMYNIFRVLRLVNNSTVDCEYPVANLYSLNSMALLGEGKTIFNANIGKDLASDKGDYTVVMYDRYAQEPDVWKNYYCSPNFNYADNCQLANRVYRDDESQAAIDNKIRINNGVYFAVRYPRAWNTGLTANQYEYGDEDNATTLYGEFRGFFHVIYPQNCGFLYSRPRVTTEELPSDLIYNNNLDFTKYWQEENIYDGGTSSYRVARAFDAHGGNVALAGYPDPSDAKKLQGPYINHLPNTASGSATGPTPTGDVVCDRNYYRVWEIMGAGGDSQVEAVLVAKTDGTNADKFFTTTTTIPLSPINHGGYVIIRHEATKPWGNWGDDVNMVNAGVISQQGGSSDENYAYFVEGATNHGWHGPVANTDQNVISELAKIKDLPNTTFGLSIKPMERLSETQTNNGGSWTTTGDMLVSIGSVSDDNYLDNTRLYAGGEGATMLQLCLTYSNLLDRNTVLSPMTIFFDEYTSDGTKLYTTEVRITITTQTTIDQNFDEPLYALEFGKGDVHDKFSVKATLPIFSMIPGATESVLKVESIGALVFNTELTGGNPQLVSVSAFNGMSASEIEENVVAIKFGPSLTYDNTQGWLSGYSYDDPEASLVDITTLGFESTPDYLLGMADGRKNIGMQFDLYYNGSVHFQGDNDVEICHFPLTLSVSNLAGTSGDADLEIMVYVYKRGKGTDWYIDGVNGRNSNKGHNPDHAKLTLNGVLADEYKPGDNIFIVNQVTINSVNTTIWPDEKGGSEGVTLYRYPGGHTLKYPEAVFQNGCYSGPLVVAQSDLQLYGIVLNGLDSICYNGKQNYTINNVMYQKGQDFDFTVNSPLVIVENDGTVTMNRSEFIYNNNQSSSNLGGAILVGNGGTLDINGQSFITNNKTTTSEGAGVYVGSGATVNVMDDVYVAGNTKGSVRSNVYLPDVASVINIDKENGMSPISLIGVTKNAFPTGKSFTPIAFSSAQHNSEDAFNQGFFFDDQSIYAVYYDRYDDELSENNIYFAKTWVTEVTSEPSGWDITNINQPEDLAWLISYVNGYNGSEPHPNAVATVTADIDMNRCIWVPIGDATHNFEGVFDGGGYDISGLRCSMTGISSQGLFGYVDGGTVKNTFVLGGTLTAKDRDRVYMGSIAGVVKNGGKVYASEGALNLNTIAESTIMGGLVGLLDESTLHSSISVANLNGYQMGGLVGETTEGSALLNCYAFSMFNDAMVENESGVIIPNTHYVAGLVADNDITIENCYVRRRKQNNVASINTFDAHNKGNGEIKKCYTYEGDATAYTDIAASPEFEGSTCLYEDATHPYTYGENYNHTVRNAKIGPEMLKVLNMNVDTLCNIATYPGYNSDYQDEMVRWTRTTSDINNDYPVLKMPAGMAVSTNLTDSILYYHHTLNEALTRYSSTLRGYSGNAIVDAYANSETPVSVAQTENVKLYINEDVAVLQTVDLNAYVGITLDNSAGVNGANPTNGEPDDVDWHMFSSSLQNAPMGLNYSDNAQHDWWTQSHAAYYSFYPDDDALAGYFPGNTPTVEGKNNFDLYCFYEPEYHWINFKRNGNSHWHQDSHDEIHDWINYGYTGNDYSGSGTTNKYTFGKNDNNESEFIRGKGYMLAVEQETYLQAYGKLNNGNVTYYNVTHTEDAHCPGINLIGNPYQSYLDFKAFADANAGTGKIWSAANKAFYSILDEDKGGYVNYHYDASWNEYAANRYIHMHQGFFIVTVQDSTTAVFDNTMRNAKGYNTTFRDEEMPRYPLVNLILSEADGNRDYAVVELSRPQAGGATKIKNLRSGRGQIYVHYNDEDYSIAFTEAGVTSVPVRFNTSERDVFTLNWNTQNGTFSYLHLIDNLTGVDVDCLENEEYVFAADPSDYDSRFKLVFAYTGVEENEIELPDNFAFFNGDDLIVNGEGRLECIDLQGRVLFVTDLYGSQNHVALPDFSSGMYLLSLRNGKQCLVQKIIIK